MTARKYRERVLEARKRLFGDEHPATLTALMNLADSLERDGEYETARSYREAVAARQRTLRHDDPKTEAPETAVAH